MRIRVLFVCVLLGPTLPAQDRAATDGGIVTANVIRLAGGDLLPDVPQRFILPVVSEPTFFADGLYQLMLTSGTNQFQVDIVTDDPLADVDLFLARGSTLSTPAGALRSATSPYGVESIVVTGTRAPYVAGLMLKTTGRQVTGTIRLLVSNATIGGTVLTSQRPASFSLTAGQLTRTKTFYVNVPENARSLQLQTRVLAPAANVDLFGRNAVVPGSISDHRAATASGDEILRIDRNSNPPLRTGRYFVNVTLGTPSQAAEGLITAVLTTEPPILTTLSAATLKPGPLAVDSAVETRGEDIAFVPDSVAGTEPPESLSGASVELTDSIGQRGSASVLAVGRSTITWIIPEWAAEGDATVRVTTHTASIQEGPLAIVKTSPSLYSADGTGVGPALGLGVRTGADGEVTRVPLFDCAILPCQNKPLDLGADTDETVLHLVGAGLRHAEGITAVMGGEAAPVAAFGPHPELPGRDLIEVRVPRSLYGVGVVALTLTAGSKESNPVWVSVGGPGGKPFPRLTTIQPAKAGRDRTIRAVRLSGLYLAEVTAIDIGPQEDVTVSNIRPGPLTVTFDLTISSPAALGSRTVTAVSPAGRSNSLQLEITDAPQPGPPQISNLSITQTRGSTIQTVVRFDFSDPDGDMSLSPVYSIFSFGANALCGSTTVGQTRNDGLFSGTIELRFSRPSGALLRPPVRITVSVRDAAGQSSNSLELTRNEEFVCP